MTDGRTDGRNCDSICVLSMYAVARKNVAKTPKLNLRINLGISSVRKLDTVDAQRRLVGIVSEEIWRVLACPVNMLRIRISGE